MFVDTTAGSFPFLRKLAAPRRVVITATDAAAQQFERVFPEVLHPRADRGRGRRRQERARVGVGSVQLASAQVRQYYEQKAQLPTERALIDDTGEGAGHDLQSPAASGRTLSRAVFLQREAPPPVVEDEAADLRRSQADLERQIDSLKVRKDEMAADQYDAQLEPLLLDLARVSAALRDRE